MTFWPRLATCASTCALAPLPMPIIEMTAATPMMMPRAVSIERSLFRPSARIAILTVAKEIMYRSTPPPAADEWVETTPATALRGQDTDDDLVAFLQTFQDFRVRAIADPGLDKHRL